MEGGRVRAAGPVADLVADPALPLAARTGAAAVVEGVVTAIDAPFGLAHVRIDGAEMLVAAAAGPVGTRRRLRIKAEDVSICRVRPVETSILNVLPARVRAVLGREGHQVTVLLSLGEGGGGARLLARISARSYDVLGLTRITSYNVCYTKLLRTPNELIAQKKYFALLINSEVV